MHTKAELMKPVSIATLLLFAGAMSTTPAQACDRVSFDTTEVSSEQIEESSREQARQANEAAVEDAAKAVEADTRLDLDITLIGRTSLLIAGEV